ncbi:MAG TPA: phosphoribosylamine--glycine ligase [Deltaproteobacteria bacterium]|nr:phosphoribosylamine--glycine ligase [Deltaproteobacteria bacterium]
MRVVLVGSGGREAALAWRLARSPSLSELWVTGENPGWPPGTSERSAATVAAQAELAREVGADLVVVGPEGPLVEGLADALHRLGIPCFGPTQAAARLESSKAATKEICAAAGVPTAAAVIADRDDRASMARAEARCARGRVVVKADGLAAGKGVIVCESPGQAAGALEQLAHLGGASARLVLEDLLEGPEVSVFALCDGARAVALPSAQDHKQLLDGGRGPNTGGMGAICPCPLVDHEQAEALVAAVHQPVIAELARRGHPYRGVLYAGLMLTRDGPMLLEFNVRFGDPECQAMMPLWGDDPLPWLHGAAIGSLPAGAPRFAPGAACCVVLASAGYPARSDRGRIIPEPEPTEGVIVFHAGTRRDRAGLLRTDGGRVLGITGTGPGLEVARSRAYAAVEGWRFEGAQLRTDIGLSVVAAHTAEP